MADREHKIKLGLAAVTEGRMSIYQAAQEWDLPESTLRYRMKNNNTTRQESREPLKLLSKEKERELAEWCADEYRKGTPITHKELRIRVRTILQDRGNREAKVGKDWVKGFLRRNRNVQTGNRNKIIPAERADSTTNAKAATNTNKTTNSIINTSINKLQSQSRPQPQNQPQLQLTTTPVTQPVVAPESWYNPSKDSVNSQDYSLVNTIVEPNLRQNEQNQLLPTLDQMSAQLFASDQVTPPQMEPDHSDVVDPQYFNNELYEPGEISQHFGYKTGFKKFFLSMEKLKILLNLRSSPHLQVYTELKFHGMAFVSSQLKLLQTREKCKRLEAQIQELQSQLQETRHGNHNDLSDNLHQQIYP